MEKATYDLAKETLAMLDGQQKYYKCPQYNTDKPKLLRESLANEGNMRTKCKKLIQEYESSQGSLFQNDRKPDILAMLENKWQTHIAKYYNEDSIEMQAFRQTIINEYQELIQEIKAIV